MELPENLDLDNDEFKLALQVVQDTNHNLFLTGRAGTGKSTFLTYIRKNVKKKFVVLAPTGIAAVNVKGQTIHSFFLFPLRPLMARDPHIKKFSSDSSRAKVIKQMDTLIIDEVSMVRADLLDAIDASLRKNTGKNAPFGGKQVILIGDVFQLEPVHRKDSPEARFVEERYPNPFFFSADVLKSTPLMKLELKKIYRQKDIAFIHLIEKIRHCSATFDDLQPLNRSMRGLLPTDEEDFAITLTTTNRIAQNVNQKRLEAIKEETFQFEGMIDGDYDTSKLPTDMMLNLKLGAQVMFVKNDIDGRWVNGSIAQIIDIGENFVQVKMERGQIHYVDLTTWEEMEYDYDEKTGVIAQEVKGAFTQFPLKLAWAITIHKSQGLTFDKVVIDLGRGAFAGGQVYVALSRCRSLEGIRLKGRVLESDIFIHPAIQKFADSFPTNVGIQQNLGF